MLFYAALSKEYWLQKVSQVLFTSNVTNRRKAETRYGLPTSTSSEII